MASARMVHPVPTYTSAGRRNYSLSSKPAPAAAGEQRWPRAAGTPRSIPRTAEPPRPPPPAQGMFWLNSPAPPLHSCLPAFPVTFSVRTRGCKGRIHQRYFQTLRRCQMFVYLSEFPFGELKQTCRFAAGTRLRGGCGHPGVPGLGRAPVQSRLHASPSHAARKLSRVTLGRGKAEILQIMLRFY